MSSRHYISLVCIFYLYYVYILLFESFRLKKKHLPDEKRSNPRISVAREKLNIFIASQFGCGITFNNRDV